jgi:hypothetical protein
MKTETKTKTMVNPEFWSRPRLAAVNKQAGFFATLNILE